MTGIGAAIKGIFKGGDIVEKVGNVVDKFHTSQEEKEQLKIELTKVVNQHEQFLEGEITKRLEVELKDNQDARNREIQIANSEKAPMLNKIVTPVLALGIVGLTFIMWYMILYRKIPAENKDTANIIVGSLTTLAMGVVSYYFGSSASSKSKQEFIQRQK